MYIINLNLIFIIIIYYYHIFIIINEIYQMNLICDFHDFNSFLFFFLFIFILSGIIKFQDLKLVLKKIW